MALAPCACGRQDGQDELGPGGPDGATLPSGRRRRRRWCGRRRWPAGRRAPGRSGRRRGLRASSPGARARTPCASSALAPSHIGASDGGRFRCPVKPAAAEQLAYRPGIGRGRTGPGALGPGAAGPMPAASAPVSSAGPSLAGSGSPAEQGQPSQAAQGAGDVGERRRPGRRENMAPVREIATSNDPAGTGRSCAVGLLEADVGMSFVGGSRRARSIIRPTGPRPAPPPDAATAASRRRLAGAAADIEDPLAGRDAAGRVQERVVVGGEPCGRSARACASPVSTFVPVPRPGPARCWTGRLQGRCGGSSPHAPPAVYSLW